MARDKYLEKFIDAGFTDLKEHLQRIEKKNDERMDDLDKENTARHVDNQKRLDALEKDVGFVIWLAKLLGTVLTTAAAAVGLWKGTH